MGLILFILFSTLEIVLAVKGRGKEKGKKVWLKSRLFIRLAEIAVVLIVLLLPIGQKWRLIPLLGFLAVLGIIALLKWCSCRKKENAEKKTGSVVFNCVFNILLIGLLLIPAFVFTGYKGLPVSGPHPVAETSAILIDSSRTDPFEQDGSFREVPVHFYYPADAADGASFPLAVFSHGAFGYYQSNSSTYMELAGSGYVVASLDHPHHAFFTKDSAGKTVIVDTGFFQTAMAANGDPNDNAEANLSVFREWMDLRTADMNFVVDTLEAAGASGGLDGAWFLPGNDAGTVLAVLRMTDLTKIGLMGHSMGGATAVQLGRERSDISAVIDLDGTMLGEYTGVENGKLAIREDAYPIPVLEFNNWETYNDRKEYLAQGGRYPNDELIRNAAEGYAVTIRDTEHMDFTDLPLLSPFLGKMLGSGERGCEETIDDTFYHPMNKGGTGAQRLFSGNVGLIYPDFISRDNETRIIADAKYKPIDNIGNKDYLQVLAYMFRFDAKTGYYLYPEAAGTDDLQLWMNKGSTYEANVTPRDDISLTKHGLKIPVNAENYEMFVTQMKASESEFRQAFAAG